MKRAIILFTFALLASSPAFGQTGFPPHGSFEGGQFEAVNRQNLNLNFAIPIMASPGRGFALSHALHYNSLVWQRGFNAWWPMADASGNPTWGWALEHVTGAVYYDVVGDSCTTYDEYGFPVINPYLIYSNYRYVDAQGTVHYFGLEYYTGMGASACGVAGGTLTGYSVSGYYIDATSLASAVVTAPSGVKIASSGTLFDVNGNYISKTVSGNTTEWKDTAGRVALKIVKTSSYIDYLYLDGAGSTSYQTIRVNLGAISVKTNFGCSGVTEFTSTGTVNVPVSIDLPNGRSYTFEYEVNSTHTSYKTGRVSKVTLPTGGYVEYSYPGSNGGVNCADGAVINLTKKVNNAATWTFERTTVTGGWKTKVVDPAMPYDNSVGNESVHIFTNGRETSHKIYQGSESSGTLLRTINTTWATNETPEARTIILEDNQTKATVTTSYDDYGNVAWSSETGWYTGSSGTVLRTTEYAYLNSSNYTSRNIRNRVTSVIVRDGGSSGTVKSRTTIAYDESSFINTACPSGASQHDDTNYSCSFTYRGLPTTVTTYTNAATPSGAITRSTFYDWFGNVRKGDVNCCQQKEFVFSNATSTIQYSMPSSVVQGPSTGAQLETSATYNAYSGLVTTSLDANGQDTNYTYDALKRVLSVQRPDDVTINYNYDDTYRIVRVETPVQGSDKIRQRTYSDDLGRPIKVTVTNASDTQVSVAETQYDPLGRPFKQSNPHNGTASYWTETRFDALGRPTKIIAPDSAETLFTYALSKTTVTDPAGKVRATVADALGRTIEVHEPAGGSAAAAGGGSSTVSGSLQSTSGSSATSGTGSGSVSGSIQSSGGTSAAAGTGSVTITGTEQPYHDQIYLGDECVDWYYPPEAPAECLQWEPQYENVTYWDTGDVSITVNGAAKTVSYGQSSTTSSVATALANAINADSGYPASASASGAVVYLTSKATGTASNYSLTVNSYTTYTAYFSSPSFVPVRSGANFTGGQNSVPTTYDSGNAWVTVNGTQKSVRACPRFS